MFKVKDSLLPVPKEQMSHSSKHRRFPPKSKPFAAPQRHGLEGLMWGGGSGMAVRYPVFSLCFSALERKEPPDLGLCPGAVLSVSLRAASLPTAPELACVPFTFRVQRLPATFVMGSKPHSALPFEGEACGMILSPGFQYIKCA